MRFFVPFERPGCRAFAASTRMAWLIARQSVLPMCRATASTRRISILER